MISVPEPFLIRLSHFIVHALALVLSDPSREVGEALAYEAYTSGGVCDKDEVKMGWVGVEEAEDTLAGRLDAGGRKSGGRGFGVWVSVEV